MQELYNILNAMKDNEVYIEYAWIEKGNDVIKLSVKKVVQKKELSIIRSGLKSQYQGDSVLMSTIFK